MSDVRDFVVRRDDLRRTDFVPAEHTENSALAPGEALVRVARFALTANNVTYGAVGEMIGYWAFFPAADGWGRIPVWGFAEVVRSEHPEVRPGERLYGYLPMSRWLVLRPERVTAGGFVDATPHRAALPAVYNQYVRVPAESGRDAVREAHVAIFRPLFGTAFLLDDWLAEEGLFGARAVVLTSASSKTALGLAFLLHDAQRGAVVGLTSAANRAFVEGTGYYDRVLPYEEVGALAADTPSVLVDFAGNAGVVRAVHERLGAALRRSIAVGLTHWERAHPSTPPPGPTPEFFFAPDRFRQRATDWSAAELQRRVTASMDRFLASARWLTLVEGTGPEALESAYRTMLEGRADPATGWVLAP